MMHILYISLNGVEEPLVVSQVLAYLNGLRQRGYTFTLLTFERRPLSQERASTIAARLSELGIDWQWLPRARRAGAFSIVSDLVRGYRRCRQVVRSRKIGAVHARSFVPAVIGALLKRRWRVPLVNDMRGFWVDEKVYKGSIRASGLAYRIGKLIEGWTLRNSDVIVMLSERGRRELASFACFEGREVPPAVVIPTCVEIERFTPSPGQQNAPLVCGYIGSMSAEYLPDKVIEYFAVVREHFPDSVLRLVTRSEPGPIMDLIHSNGIPAQAVSITAVSPAEVPAETARFDLGLCFIRPHFSKLASCPTKVGEYLAAGVPVVSNAGIGDLDDLLRRDCVGIILPDVTREAMMGSMSALRKQLSRPGLREACRRTAEMHFSLERGIAAYASIYEAVSPRSPR